MWEPVDPRFYGKSHPVEIVAVGDQIGSAHCARALLEELGAVVLLHCPGTPDDFLKVISQGAGAAPHLIICGHGDENGIVFGQYASFIDASMLQKGSLPPENIAEGIDLPGCVVISTACGGGEEPMARAFMSGGLKAYIGTVTPDPHFSAEPLFLAHLFYALFRSHCSEREAWEQAAAYDKDSRLYVYWDRDGLHRIE